MPFEKPNRFARQWLPFLAVLLFLLSACSANSETSQGTPTDTAPELVQEVSASGEVVPVQWVILSYPVGATELEFKVSEGDRVSRNDRLVSNDDDRLLAAQFQALSALERAQAAYDQVSQAPSEASLASARAALANAEANLQRQEDLGASNFVIEAAQADLDAAEANLRAVQDGSSREEILAAEHDLRAAELGLRQAEAAFDLIAPFPGTVVAIHVKPGEPTPAFQPVITLADLSDLQVITTDLSEVDVTRLEIGQQANIVFDAISDQTFSGTISKIANKASGVSSVYYEVTLSLNELPAGLRWGMTAFVIFPLE